MNKRQKKKRDKFIKLCVEYGYHYIPTYKELKVLERSFHEFCINKYRTEREMERVFTNRFVALS